MDFATWSRLWDTTQYLIKIRFQFWIIEEESDDHAPVHITAMIEFEEVDGASYSKHIARLPATLNSLVRRSVSPPTCRWSNMACLHWLSRTDGAAVRLKKTCAGF